MARQNIIARFTDGRVLRGHTDNFNQAGPSFCLRPVDAPATEPILVDTSDLKAVIFVKTFEGNPNHDKCQDFKPGQTFQGSKIEVEFTDGEILIGSTPIYDTMAQGFFIFPADEKSNTIKLFAMNRCVKKARLMGQAPRRLPAKAVVQPRRQTFAGLRSWLKRLIAPV